MMRKCFSLKRSLALAWLMSGVAVNLLAGLTGEYFDNADFTTLRATRVDATVDFDWGSASPTNSVGVDTFSVRWSGQVESPLSTNFTFYVTADDGARLWVNDRLVCGRTMSGTGAIEQRATVALTAGQRVNLVLEYVENTGQAVVRLEWSAPGLPREVVPAARLFPTLGTPERGAILAEYWTGLGGTNLAALTNHAHYPARPDGREFLTSFECLQRDWADNFGTRVTGWVVPPETGNYAFAVSADETAELYLSTNELTASAQRVATVPGATGFREFTRFTNQVSAPKPMVAGQKYFIELRCVEGSGGDHFSVAWQRPGTSAWQVLPAEVLVPAGLDRTAPAQGAFLATLAASHPRVLASAQRFDWLQRTLASNSVPQLNSWWTTLRNSADSILTNAVSVYTPDNRGTILGISRTVLDRAGKLALAWRLTGNTNYAERAWAELEAAANFPDWHPAHFLDTAEMTHAFALGYDWLYAYWTPARRTVLTNAIVSKGLKQSLSIYTNYSSWAASSANNWNLVCNGGMTLGALALGDENAPLTEYILSRATASAGWVMRHYTTDQGGWYEGPGYWDYTTEYNMRLLAGLESALGSDFGLSATRATWETGVFPIHMVGPGLKSFNFADAGAGNMRGAQLFWLARRYCRPEFAWHERANVSVEPLDLLWFDARGSDPVASGIAAANWFCGPTGTTPYATADAVTLRTRFGDSEASFAGFKAGEIGASHGHLDAGSFVFDALGQRWAHDLGGDDYALAGYFSDPQRWTYYRLRAEGHNTLVINPGSGADQITSARPPVLLFQDQPGSEASVVADLTSAYGVTRVWRGLSLCQNRRWLLVQDEIAASTPATVWWFLHVQTNTAPVIAPDRTSVMLTQGSARLWVKVLAGGGTFAVSNAVPLPSSPNPTGQNANATYQKLALKLTGVTNTTLAVLLVPLRSGETAPTNLPTLIPLNQWGTNSSSLAVPAPLSTARVFPLWQGSALDVDLAGLVQNTNATASRLRYSVGPATNGSVTLLADDHTARFTPASGYAGPAGFGYTVTQPLVDARAIGYFDFEPPESVTDGGVTDKSPAAHDASITTLGSGSAGLSVDVPTPLAGVSAQSVRLTERGDGNGARLVGPALPADYDFNTRDWTLAGWFKRATTTNDDFIFYLGDSDGFGSPDELHLHCASGGNTLRLAHWIATSTTDCDLTIANVLPNVWYHAAVVFDATNGNSGTLRLYLNGALAGTDPTVALNLPSGADVVLGGHGSTTFATARWFNGWLDDAAVFAAALTPAEISFLAGHPAGEMSGRTETNAIEVVVNPVNHPPTLATVADRSLMAGQTLWLTNQATDTDGPNVPLTFALAEAPAGAVLNSANGVLQWRPTLADAGQDWRFRVSVSDTGSVVVLPPEADTFVRADQPAATAGFEPLLTTRLSTNPVASSEAFLRFDLAALPQPPVTARLQLTAVVATNVSAHALSLVTNDVWSEAALTWGNRPAAANTLGVFTPVAGGASELALTTPAQAEAVGDGRLSLRVGALLASTNGWAKFASREQGAGAWPRLTLGLAPLTATNSFRVNVLRPAPPQLAAVAWDAAGFHLSVQGDPGPDYFVDGSTDLRTWAPLLATNSPALPLVFLDATTSNAPTRFYRVRLGP